MSGIENTFADLDRQTGWDQDSQLCLLIRFIESKNLVGECCDFLEQQAEDEAAECGNYEDF